RFAFGARRCTVTRRPARTVTLRDRAPSLTVKRHVATGGQEREIATLPPRRVRRLGAVRRGSGLGFGGAVTVGAGGSGGAGCGFTHAGAFVAPPTGAATGRPTTLA